MSLEQWWLLDSGKTWVLSNCDSLTVVRHESWAMVTPFKRGTARAVPLRYVPTPLASFHKSFLPCDAMHSAAIAVTRCLSVRPSVRPSVTFASCAKTNKDIVETFSPSGSQAILVFPHQTGWRYSDGNPLMGASNARGVWKNDDFRPISRCISETVIVRWAHAARQFISIKLSFHPYNI